MCGALSATAGPREDAELLAAAEAGSVPAIARALENGAAIDAVDDRGNTPVMRATLAGRVDAVKRLVADGADVNRRNAMSDNPFLYAGAEGLLDILRVVAPKADPTLLNRYGGTPLIPASEHGHVEVVRYLLERTRVNVNHVNNLGWTALMECIVLSDGGPRQQQVLQLLLQHGADPGIPDRDGVSALRHAEQRGQTAMAKLLRAAGAKP
ncbi:ankyrin repeat domain-containing protein [Uliginosibacterium sp. H1]|uniref:ankyrin repeat domain-containing protein n=1 Tax=Uliginosibacterium sp. H1 TaxID=3114757 RepID=UPI002E187746|nr:ankyrin repeat domain-containing protein [Uliginosibacterium sp. H1]